MYGVGLFAIWTGAKHTYWAWTGQREKLTIISGGFEFISEGPALRERLWKVGGPFVVLVGVTIIFVVTNFLILCELSESYELIPTFAC
ncbi:MAG: hypothetical protein ABEI52_03515 [Halobacteriaceae archaeon]